MNNQIQDTPRTDIQPIHRIPAELLAEIFLHTLPDQKFNQPSPNDAPLVLGNVCSSWRRVSISTPRLWSSISARASHKGWEPHLSLIKLWLARSGVCPLFLRLTQSNQVDDNWSTLVPCDAEPALDLFISHFSHWKEIEFVLDKFPVDPWRRIPHTGAPLLERVDLALGYSPLSDVQILAVSRIFSPAPRLRHIFWSNPYHSPCEASIPWAQLVDLYLVCRMAPNEVLVTLRLCVNAEICYFSNIVDGLVHQPTCPKVLLPELRALTICINGGLENFLDSLTLPALENIEVFQNDDIPSWPQSQFVSLLSRSRCLLGSLSLGYTNISEDNLIQCLRLNSRSLRRLKISNRGVISITDKLLTMLTCQVLEDEQNDYLCPALEVIELTECCFSSSDGVLADLVLSRWGPNAPDDVAQLCYVELEFLLGQTAQHPLDCARLTELRNEGLRVRLKEET